MKCVFVSQSHTLLIPQQIKINMFYYFITSDANFL